MDAGPTTAPAPVDALDEAEEDDDEAEEDEDVGEDEDAGEDDEDEDEDFEEAGKGAMEEEVEEEVEGANDEEEVEGEEAEGEAGEGVTASCRARAATRSMLRRLAARASRESDAVMPPPAATLQATHQARPPRPSTDPSRIHPPLGSLRH